MSPPQELSGHCDCDLGDAEAPQDGVDDPVVYEADRVAVQAVSVPDANPAITDASSQLNRQRADCEEISAPSSTEIAGLLVALVQQIAEALRSSEVHVTVTTEAGETYAEVAHEAIFKRWDKLKEWIVAQRYWRRLAAPGRRRGSRQNRCAAIGFALKQAQSWLAERKADVPKVDQDFIVQSCGIGRARARVPGMAWQVGAGSR